MESTALRFEYQVSIRRGPRSEALHRKVVPPAATAAGDFAPVQKILALAYVIEERIRTGTLPNYAAAARWLGVTTARISQIVGLMLLEPAIQERILCAPPQEVGSLRERHVRPVTAQPCWGRQMRAWKDLASKGRAPEGALAASVSTA